jgi:GAF domain-containing protein
MADAYLADLANASSVTAVGEVVRTAARRLTGADGATFVLRDGARGELCFYADEDAIAPLWKGQRFPIGECISGWAMLHRQPVAVPDITVDERIPQDAYRPTFVRSLLMVPIGRPDPVGAIGTYWASTGSGDASDRKPEIRALERLADAAAEAIGRIGLDGAPWAPNFRVPGASTRREAHVG